MLVDAFCCFLAAYPGLTLPIRTYSATMEPKSHTIMPNIRREALVDQQAEQDGCKEGPSTFTRAISPLGACCPQIERLAQFLPAPCAFFSSAVGYDRLAIANVHLA